MQLKSRVSVLVLLVLMGWFPLNGEAQSSNVDGLETLFSEGPIFQDRNGDEVIDFVDVELLIGDSPSAGVIAAASDVAARLGYETMGMNLPFAASQGVGIFIGAESLSGAGVSLETAGLVGLSPGDGIVKVLSEDGRSWVVVAGLDEAGTRAAALAVAGYLPHIGEPKGTTLHDAVADITTLLTENSVEAASVHVDSIVVKADEEGFQRFDVVVDLGSADARRRARSVFRDIARRSERSPDDDEEAPLSYKGSEVLRVVLTRPGATAIRVDIPRVPVEEDGGPIPSRPGAGAKKKLDLSNLYTNDGLLGDSDKNLIPDRVDAMLSPYGSGVEATLDVAARLGLESTGIVLPLAQPPDDIEDPEKSPTLVLIGDEHPLIRELNEENHLNLPIMEAGEGHIQVVPKAFGEKSAVIVTGGDEAGVKRALGQVAERFPHVWERGKDRTTLDDIEMDLWRFFSGRSPAGQASIALYKLDQLVSKLASKDLESAHILVSLEKPADGLESVIRGRASRLGAESLEVSVDDRDVENARVLLDDEFTVPSEVETFWEVFRSKVLPKVKKRRPVVVDVRLSEPLEIRNEIASQIKAELTKKGAREPDMTVRVLSAYKQGYSWLYDDVRKQLEGKSVGDLTIRFAECGPPAEWPHQAIHTPIRWLKEIFPIDEVLAKEIGIEIDAIRFEKTPVGSTTYEVIATDTSGNEIYRDTFEPKVVLRPYADRFRDYEMVRVTTGWIRAEVRDDVVVDERIPTDVERFWDHFQKQTLPAIYDYVMDRHEAKPRGNGLDAPYFGKLTVDVSLSEPNYLLGIDKEIISPLDALHEEIYLHTLTFFRLLGRNARGQELTHIGRVIPTMRPKSDGKPGQAKIAFTGFATSRPAVVVEYKERDGSMGSLRLDIPKVTMERPSALAARVRQGQKGLEQLDVRVKVDTEKDLRDELILRARGERVDEQMLSAEQVKATFENLQELRDLGRYASALAYYGVKRLQVSAGWEHDIDQEAEIVTTLMPNGRPSPYPDIGTLLPTGYRHRGEELVQWETPIPPGEANGIMAKMSTFPEATAYKVGESYLGRDIWAMDFMPPLEVSHWSHAKATTLKPTVVYSGRQHANEVSSTSHLLKLGELLLTHQELKTHLDKVNVVIHPLLNADSAQLAYDLYKLTPEFILHAGYYGPLGADVTAGSREDLPIYPESKVRPRLWDTWLPDIFLNPHGYPSHQVVQLFSEFDGLVRRGRVTERNWGMNRGWLVPGFGYYDDPELPHHKDAAFQIREAITRAMNVDPKAVAANRRAYDRHEKYGVQFDKETYKVDMTNDVLVYMPLKGAKAQAQGGARRGYNPKVTIWSGVTEAPDETAHGEWMHIMATMGLEVDKALLKYLAEGDHKVERKGSTFWRGVQLSMNRPRPPEPEDADEEDKESSR